MGEDFQQRLAQLRAKVAATQAAQPVAPAPGPVAAPSPSAPVHGDGAKEELRALDLAQVYQRWFAPAAVRQGGGDEINMSCFSEWHARGDQNPQFGVNTAKGTYYCHACEVTGDIIDLTAVKYGISTGFPEYKCPPERVHEAVRFAGEELCGMTFRASPAGYQRVQPLPVAGAAPAALPAPVPQAPTEQVVAYSPGATPRMGRFTAPTPVVQVLAPDLSGYVPPDTAHLVDDADPVRELPDSEQHEQDRLWKADFKLDWRSFVPEGTPLRRYMELVCEDDSPEEFHFMNFLSLIGLTIGKRVFIPDSKPVYGNLLTCLIGRSGQKKSRSESYVDNLLASALPFDESDVYTQGVRIIPNPGSGEYMVRQFTHEIEDPTWSGSKKRGTKVPTLINPGVKGLVRWPEMATMVRKASSASSIIQQMVIELYDNSRMMGGGSVANGSFFAPNPYGSVMTTTQLKTLRNLVTTDDASSGFLNRWLFVIGQSKPIQPRGRIIDVSPLKHDVELLSKWAEGKNTHDRGWHNLDDSKGGSGELYDWMIIHDIAPLEAHETELLSRAVLTFKKLVLLFSANMMEDVISREAIEQARRVFDYLIDCLKHVGIRLTRTEEDALENAVLDDIQSSPNGKAAWELSRIARRKHLGVSIAQVKKMIDMLESLGRIELRTTAQPAGKVGRPSQRYYLVSQP